MYGRAPSGDLTGGQSLEYYSTLIGRVRELGEINPSGK